jgi:hypothetical protein
MQPSESSSLHGDGVGADSPFDCACCSSGSAAVASNGSKYPPLVGGAATRADQPHGAGALAQEFHIDCTERTWGPGQVAAMRTHQQVVIRAQDLLDHCSRGTAAKQFGGGWHVRYALRETGEAFTPVVDQLSLDVRRHEVANAGRHPWQHVNDLHARAAPSRQTRGLL